jgi:hypothetical protein
MRRQSPKGPRTPIRPAAHHPYLKLNHKLGTSADKPNPDFLSRALASPGTATERRPSSSPPKGTVLHIRIADLVINNNHRALAPEKVKYIKESINLIGLGVPITVRYDEQGKPVVLAGVHRVEAAKSLNWETIQCIVFEGSDIDARLWTIAENLHRLELTVLERSEEVAEWVNLFMQRQWEAGQCVPAPDQPRDFGIRKAARFLPTTGQTFEACRKQLERLMRISRISVEAKEAAKEAGLANHQSALDEVARQRSPDAQVAKVHARAQRLQRPRGKRNAAATGGGENPESAEELEEPTPTAFGSSPAIEEDCCPDLPAVLHRHGEITVNADQAFALLQTEWTAATEFRSAWVKAPKAARDRFIAVVLHADS